MVTISGLLLLVVGLVLGFPLVTALGGLALLVGIVVFLLDSADAGTRAHFW